MQSVPGGVGWVIQVDDHVRFQAGHPAARSDQPRHFRQYRSGIGDVDQHGPGVGTSNEAGGSPVAGVCLDDLDVRLPLFGHQLPRHGDVDRVDLQSYDAAPGADALGEQLEDSTRAASDVDRALSLSGADSVQ